jgi:hypothetical protein
MENPMGGAVPSVLPVMVIFRTAWAGNILDQQYNVRNQMTICLQTCRSWTMGSVVKAVAAKALLFPAEDGAYSKHHRSNSSRCPSGC